MANLWRVGEPATSCGKNTLPSSPRGKGSFPFSSPKMKRSSQRHHQMTLPESPGRLEFPWTFPFDSLDANIGDVIIVV
jgi:hypothetical protein